MTGTLTFVGTATTLMSYGGFTVLTDPNFLHRGQRAYLGKGLWSRRLTEPAMQPADLPPLDAVVLSHLHGDHFDRIARRGLSRDLPVVTTRPSARTLRRWGFEQAVALDTWQTHELVKDGGTAAGHGGAGPPRARPGAGALPEVMGSVLEFVPAPGGEPPLTVYVTGDTLMIDDLREVPRRHPVARPRHVAPGRHGGAGADRDDGRPAGGGPARGGAAGPHGAGAPRRLRGVPQPAAEFLTR